MTPQDELYQNIIKLLAWCIIGTGLAMPVALFKALTH